MTKEIITDKLVREAVGELDDEFWDNQHYEEISDELKLFLETKIRQAVEETKERLTLENKVLTSHMDLYSQTFFEGYNEALSDLEELKKSI